MRRSCPKYHLYVSNEFFCLMSANKRGCNNTSVYNVSQLKDDVKKSAIFCQSQMQFLGIEFSLYNSLLNQEKNNKIHKIQIIINNILGSKRPLQIVVIICQIENECDQLYEFKQSNSKDGIIKGYLKNNKDQIVNYDNIHLKWNSKHKAVDKPSVKNFQFRVDNKDDNKHLQFERVTQDLLHLDFQYSITRLQAFQIALTSFDYKIACE